MGYGARGRGDIGEVRCLMGTWPNMTTIRGPVSRCPLRRQSLIVAIPSVSEFLWIGTIFSVNRLAFGEIQTNNPRKRRSAAFARTA